MPGKRRRTTKAENQPTIPLCSECGYATVHPPSKLARIIKPPKTGTLAADVEPTQKNVSLISQWLPQACVDLAQCEKEINRLRSRLARLEAFRDDFQKCVTRNTALVSPVRRLPTEILHKIFSLSCTPSDADDARNTSLMYPAGRTALRLGLVCSRWRSVILDIPDIWSYINVSVCSHRDLVPMLMMPSEYRGFQEVVDSVEAHPVKHLVELYLERSREHPLGITVNCSSPSYPRRKNYLSPTECICSALLSEVFRILCEASHRWRYARIRITHGIHRHLFPSFGYTFPAGNLEIPLLEEMEFLGPSVVSFSNTPRLHTLNITATPNDGSNDSDHSDNNSEGLHLQAFIPFLRAPTLRSLTLHDFTVYDLGNILRRLNADAAVEVYCHKPQPSASFSLRPFNVPAIKSLSFCDARSLVIESILKYLAAPRLTKMEFEKSSKLPLGWLRLSRGFPSAQLAGMIKRSAMPLRELKIDGYHLKSEALLEVLKQVPTVEALILNEACIGDLRNRVREVEAGRKADHDWRVEIGPETIKQIDDSSFCQNLLCELTVLDHTLLLPNLTSLELKYRPQQWPYEGQDLINMAYSRWRAPDADLAGASTSTSDFRGIASLKSLKVTLLLDTHMLDKQTRASRELTPNWTNFEQGIKELKKAGLDAQFSLHKW